MEVRGSVSLLMALRKIEEGGWKGHCRREENRQVMKTKETATRPQTKRISSRVKECGLTNTLRGVKSGSSKEKRIGYNPWVHSNQKNMVDDIVLGEDEVLEDIEGMTCLLSSN